MMRLYAVLQVSLIIGPLGACTSHGPMKVIGGCRRTEATRYERVMEHDVLNDPHLRTWVHADALRTLVQRHLEENRVLPSDLTVLTSVGSELPLLWDGWGYAIQYMRWSDREFEIRAAGSDGFYCTEDDLVGTKDQFPPYPNSRM
jgi:hypothetical protein